MGVWWDACVAAPAIALLLLCLLRYKWRRRRMERLAERLPGPPCWPFVGNIFYFLGVDHQDFMGKIIELRKRYLKEGVFRIWLGNQLFIAVHDPKHLEAILSNVKLIDKGPMFDFFHERNKGSFSLSGEKWKKHRHITVKMFHTTLMSHYVRVFNEESRILLQHLKGRPPTETFDAILPIMRCTLDIICRTAFGTHLDLQSNHDLPFTHDLTVSSEIIVQRIYKPWLHHDIIFNNTNIGREMKMRTDRLLDLTEKIINKRRADILKEEEIENSKGTNGHDKLLFIDNLLTSLKDQNLSDREQARQSFDMIIAGSDTTAVTDCHVLVMLGIYRDWQDAVHKELDLVFGNSDRDVTMSDLGSLVRMEMVIKEVLRLYTAPHSLRLLHEDVELENFTLPAGATLYLQYHGANRDARYWSHPESFHPEHFLPENVSKRPKYSYMPFSHGPRNCPGSKYGVMSVKAVLSHILRRYRVECDLKFEEMRHKPSLMLDLVGGYPIRLIRRTPAQ